MIALGDFPPIVICDGRRHNKHFVEGVFKGCGVSPAEKLAEMLWSFRVGLPTRHKTIGIGHHLAENDVLHRRKRSELNVTRGEVAIHRCRSQYAVWVSHHDAVLALHSGDIARLVENIDVRELKGSAVEANCDVS